MKITSISARRRSFRLGTALATCVACAGAAQLAGAQELPTNPTVVVGTADIPVYANTDPSLKIDIRNNNPVITWDTFGIGAGQTVSFVSSDGVGTFDTTSPYAVMNRVLGATPSNINGSLVAQNNIAVWLANAAGIVFGANGTYSGGSLVLTTLTTDIDNVFANSIAGNPSQFAGTSSEAITLQGGSSINAVGTMANSANVLVISQKAILGGEVKADGSISIVTASKVTFPAGAGSPLSFTINEGHTLGGLTVLGTGDLQGDSIVLASQSVNDAQANILGVDANAKLTATDDNGVIELRATADAADLAPAATQLYSYGTLAATGVNGAISIATGAPGGAGVAGRGIDLAGSLTADGNVSVTAYAGATGTQGDATVASDISAGGYYAVTASAVTLGKLAESHLQSAAGPVNIVATTGDIVGLGALTLNSDSAGTGAADLTLQSDAGKVDFALTTTVQAGDGTTNSDVLVKSTPTIALGNVVARSLLSQGDTKLTAPEVIKLGNVTVDKSLRMETVNGNVTTGNVVVKEADETLFLLAGGATSDLTTGTLNTNGGDIGASAGRDVTVGNASTALTGTPATGTIALYSGGKVAASNLTAGTDVYANAGTTFTATDVSAGDDVVLVSDGNLSVANVTVTGTGSDASSVTFGATPGTASAILFAAETMPGSGISVRSVNGAISGTGALKSAGGNILVNAKQDVALVDAATALTGTPTAGSIGVFAGTTAIATGTINAGEDVGIFAPGGIAVNTVVAGDDLRLVAALAGVPSGTVTATNLTARGTGPGNATVYATDGQAGQPAGLVVGAEDPGYVGTSKIYITATSFGTAPGGGEEGLQIGTPSSTFATGSTTLTANTGDIRIGTLTANTGDVSATAAVGSITGLPASFTPLAGGASLNGDDGIEFNVSGDIVAGSAVSGGAVQTNQTASTIRIGTLTAKSADLTADTLLRIDNGNITELANLATTGGAAAAFDPALNPLAPTMGEAKITASAATSKITVDAGNGADNIAKLGRIVAGDGITPFAGTQVALDGTSVSVDSIAAMGDIVATADLNILTGNYTGGTPGTFDTPSSITFTALNGKIIGKGQSDFAITEQGIGALSADGDLTVTTSGDVDLRIASISAGDDLTLGILGNLYGRTLTTTAVPGASFTGDTKVDLRADLATGTINANRIASDLVILSAANVAVGQIDAGALAGPPSTFYIGNLHFTGDAIFDATSAGSPYVANGTITTDDFYSRATSLGAGGNITGSVSEAAQISGATAGGDIDLDFGGVVANTVSATGLTKGTGLVDITTNPGTLSIKNTATAGGNLNLTKLSDSDTAGDDLRLVTGTAGGASTIASASSVRIGTLTATSGNVSVTATNGDITGLLGAGKVDALHPSPVIPASANGLFSDQYGKANVTADGAAASVTLTAANGIAQLGTIAQGGATLGSGTALVSIDAKGISADSIVANNGGMTLTSSVGTLDLVTGSAGQSIVLTKQNGNAATPGDELRFGTLTGGRSGTTQVREGLNLAIDAVSSTHVRGDLSTAVTGSVALEATGGQLTGPVGDLAALDVVANAGGVRLRSATLSEVNTINARDRISLIAGGTGPAQGEVMLGSATSSAGDIYLTAFNGTAATPNGIAFDTLTATSGSVTLITSGGNRGDVGRAGAPLGDNVNLIDAGTGIAIDARSITVDTARTAAGAVRLNASGAITAGLLQGDVIAALAGTFITVDSAVAKLGDISMRAGGVLTLGDGTASDDVFLTGSSVRVGSATAQGTGEVANPDLATLVPVKDPSADGIGGTVPSATSASETPGGAIRITATTGDVTGLAVNPGDTPALPLVARTGTRFRTRSSHWPNTAQRISPQSRPINMAPLTSKLLRAVPTRAGPRRRPRWYLTERSDRHGQGCHDR